MMDIKINKRIREGWVCPVCEYVWAIWIEGCKNCNKPEKKQTTTKYCMPGMEINHGQKTSNN